MKLKLSILAGALALAVAGQASATPIVAGNTYANNLVLSVWDQTNTTSYTANLGTTMQNFMNGLTVTGTTAPVISGTSTGGNFTFTDANLTSFLSTASANTVWSVIGVNMGVTGVGTAGIMTTSTSPVAAASVTTANLNSINAVNGGYIATANGSLATANSMTTTAAAGGLAYVGAAGNGMGNNFGGSFPYTNTAAIGQSQNFFFLTPAAGTRAGTFAGTASYEFANATGLSTFSLGSSGLTYTVAAVPEPGEWLLMFSGFGLIGFIANRRKGKGSMAFA